MFGGDWREISIDFPGLGVISKRRYSTSQSELGRFLAETRLLFPLVATAEHVSP